MQNFTGRTGEAVVKMEHWSVDICCTQRSRFRENSVRMTSGKAAECKLFCVENEKGSGVVIFLVTIWADAVTGISRASYKMIVIKILVQGIIISEINLCTKMWFR